MMGHYSLLLLATIWPLQVLKENKLALCLEGLETPGLDKEQVLVRGKKKSWNVRNVVGAVLRLLGYLPNTNYN